MSPRYREVYIPEAAAARFEAFVRTSGGLLGEKSPHPKDTRVAAEKEWVRQVAPARQLVSEFRKEHDDPNINAGIRRGLSTLATHAFGYFAKANRLKEDVRWQDVKQTLADIFDEFLPPEAPDDACMRRNKGGKLYLYRPGLGKQGFLPNQITLFMEFYGLADGVQRTSSEVGKKYGIKPPVVSESLKRQLLKIRRIPRVKKLIVKE